MGGGRKEKWWVSKDTAFELTGRRMAGRQVRQDDTCPDSLSVTVLNSRTESNLREPLREVRAGT